jgi:hypothetical protein
MILYIVAGLAKPWYTPAYTGGTRFLKISAFAGPALIVVILLERRWIKSRYLVSAVVIVTVVSLAAVWINTQRMTASEAARNRAYMEAQLWARAKTSPTALFMIDPAIHYGWRAYSHRGSFGSVREWLYVSICYSSDYPLLQEGLKRFKEFGLKLEDYLYVRPSWAGRLRLHKDIRDRYYALDDNWRLDLARRYGIDYFVMVNGKLINPSKLHVVFENQHFSILAARRSDQ